MSLEENTAEVERATAKYMENDDLVGTDVQDDLDARVAAANETHTAVQNEDDGTTLNTEDATVAGGVQPVYTGGNVVDDENPLVMDELVRDALDADEIFATAGQIPPTDFEDVNSLSPYLDMMWLVEASKKTGEKLF